MIICIHIDCTVVTETKTKLSWDICEPTDKIWWYNHIRHTTTENYNNNVKGWYFLFDDDISVTYAFQFVLFLFAPFKLIMLTKVLCTSISPRCEVTEGTNNIVDTLSTEYNQRAFTDFSTLLKFGENTCRSDVQAIFGLYIHLSCLHALYSK